MSRKTVKRGRDVQFEELNSELVIGRMQRQQKTCKVQFFGVLFLLLLPLEHS